MSATQVSISGKTILERQLSLGDRVVLQVVGVVEDVGSKVLKTQGNVDYAKVTLGSLAWVEGAEANALAEAIAAAQPEGDAQVIDFPDDD